MEKKSEVDKRARPGVAKKDIDITHDPRVNIRVSKIKVMLNTNIPGMKTTMLSFPMLTHPDLDKGRYKTTAYTLPYFTNNVKYPFDVLSKKPYADRVDFFFNKQRFNKILRKNITEESAPTSLDDPKEMAKRERKYADWNINTMLILLLPIADEFGNIYKASYDHYILDKLNPELFNIRNIDYTTLLNPSFFPIYNYFRPREYTAPIQEISYLNLQNEKYAITEVVWQNDVVNHPVYREFISVYYDKNREKQNNRQRVEDQMNDQKGLFKLLLSKYSEYEEIAPGSAPNAVPTWKTVFQVMNEILITNISGLTTPAEKTRAVNTEYTIDNTAVKINQKENTKREVFIRVMNSIGAVDDIFRGYSGKLDGQNLDPNLIITAKTAKELPNNDPRIDQIIDLIVNAYIEYTSYNESAEGGMKLTLKDTNRILSELYNSAISLKALWLVQSFVNDQIRRLDLSDKNQDGSSKTKLELDILSVLNKNYQYYVKLNNDITVAIQSVVEPARRSSNADLQNYLKKLLKPTQEVEVDENALLDIYNKYISNVKKYIDAEYIKHYMYVGVSTVVSSDTAGEKSEITASSGEIPEIYVYINVVNKEKYEKNPKRRCVVNDDRLTNLVKQVLFANVLQNNTFPEVNPYRETTLLSSKSEEATTPTDKTPTENGETSTPKEVARGGRKTRRRSRRRRKIRRHTKKTL